MLAGDACFRPPIISRFNDFHVDDIRRAMGDIASYPRGTSSLFCLVLVGCSSFGFSLAFRFCLPL